MRIEIHYDEQGDHKIVYDSLSSSVRVASAQVADLLENHMSGDNRFVRLIVLPDLPLTKDLDGTIT